MENIVKLVLSEPVRLDHEQLEKLVLQFGPAEADRTINQALEDLAVGLADIQKAQQKKHCDNVGECARSLVGTARKLGMTTLARVARDVQELTKGDDTVAFHAATARLVRIGEGSLIAVWDIQDMSL